MPNTVTSLLDKTSAFFRERKIEEHRFHAELLLAKCLKLDRLQLYMQLDRPLNETEIERYRKEVKSFKADSSEKTVKEIFDLSKKELERKEIPEAELSARYIIAQQLNIKAIELALHFEQKLSIDDIQFIRQRLRRRLKREPIQYILGETEFFGYPIKVNRSVLIPRPESEILVEVTLKTLDEDKNLSGIDIGAGSACISIALSKENPCIRMSALEYSETAIALAERNAKRNDADIAFYHLDFLNSSAWQELETYDFIVSNPPYIANTELEQLESEVVDYEPHIALTDYADGLSFYKALITFSETQLKNSGYLFLEIGAEQKKEIQSLAENSKLFSEIHFKKDLAGLDRIAILKKK